VLGWFGLTFALCITVVGIPLALVTIFGGIAATLFVFSVVLWLFSGTLVRWMHGAEKVTH